MTPRANLVVTIGPDFICELEKTVRSLLVGQRRLKLAEVRIENLSLNIECALEGAAIMLPFQRSTDTSSGVLGAE